MPPIPPTPRTVPRICLIPFLLVFLILGASPASARILWSDSFEAGGFAAAGWTNAGATRTSSTASSGIWCAALDGASSLSKAFSLDGLARITVRYTCRSSNRAAGDRFLVEWFDGKTWALLEDAAASENWQRRSFRLPANASCNPSFRLRFRALFGQPEARAFLDDVSIEGIRLVPVEVTSLSDIEKGFALKGRDGGVSFVHEGRLAMMFGDTLLSQYNAEGINWVVNTMSSTADLDARDGLTGSFNFRTPEQPANQWVPYTAAEKAFNNSPSSGTVGLWPASVFWDPLTQKHYIFTMKVIEYPGIWPTYVGMGISRVDSLSTHPVRMACRPGEDEDTLLFLAGEATNTEFGNMALVEGDSVYAYYGKGSDWGDLRVARAPLSGFTSRSQWRFWNGSQWVPEMASAAVITQSAAMGTIHWNNYLDSYLLVYMQVLGDKVKFRVADRPEGPWSNAVEAFRAERGAENAVPYGALAHAALQRDGGRTEFITYNVPGTWATGGRIPLVGVRFENEPSSVTATGPWICYD